MRKEAAKRGLTREMTLDNMLNPGEDDACDAGLRYPKTASQLVQSMLRHADIGTTLDIYTHAISRDKLTAQNQVMEAMMKPGLVN